MSAPPAGSPLEGSRQPLAKPRIEAAAGDGGHLSFRLLASPLRPRSAASELPRAGIELGSGRSPDKGRAGDGRGRAASASGGAAGEDGPTCDSAALRAALDDVAAALAAGGGDAPQRPTLAPRAPAPAASRAAPGVPSSGGAGAGVGDPRASTPPAAAGGAVDPLAGSPITLAAAVRATSPVARGAGTADAAAAPAATPTPARSSPPATATPMDPAAAEAHFIGDFMAATLGASDPASASLAGATPRALAAALADGSALCRFLNAVAPDSVDERAVNAAAPGGGALGRAAAEENAALYLDAARAAGAALPPAATPAAVASGSPAAVDAAWAIAWLALSRPLSVRATPSLAALRAPGEDEAALAGASPTTLLLRWLNHHLGASGAWARPPVDDCGGDLADGAALAALAAALGADPAPSLPELRRLRAGADLTARMADLAARAAAVHPCLAALAGGLPLPPPPALASGSRTVGAAVLATIFAASPDTGGDGGAARALEAAAAADGGEPRDDRALRVWASSMLAHDGVPATGGEFAAALREGW